MCNGGFFRDSIVLASGATGTGNTLMVLHIRDPFRGVSGILSGRVHMAGSGQDVGVSR